KGGRSARAAEILKEMGFKKIYDLEGGIVLWEESGQDTEKEQS
ncbi:rhodanese-like domain-containing protein, partial [Gilvibacter sp.]|nr:rhodanese-like domain-containing protein [Gilvibacter sp.]